MRLRFLAIAAAALLASGAAAQKRLVPSPDLPGPLAAYQADILRVFREAFTDRVRLRALVQPSFQTEYAVGLRQDGDKYEIFALRPERQVWTYQQIALYKSGRAGVLVFEGSDSDDPDKLLGDPDAEPRDGTAEAIRRLEEGLPADPADLPLARCAVEVDGGLAAALTAAWRRMLEAVRPGEEVLSGADGTSYQFSMAAEGRDLAGETWSPPRGTRPAKLARLAESMREYCETRAAERLPEMRKIADRLGSRRR